MAASFIYIKKIDHRRALHNERSFQFLFHSSRKGNSSHTNKTHTRKSIALRQDKAHRTLCLYVYFMLFVRITSVSTIRYDWRSGEVITVQLC